MAWDSLFQGGSTKKPTSNKGWGSLFAEMDDQELVRYQEVRNLQVREEEAKKESADANSLGGMAKNFALDLGNRLVSVPKDFIATTWDTWAQTPQKIADSVNAGAKDIERATSGKKEGRSFADSTVSLGKGLAKAGGRTAGNALIAVYAPLGGAIAAVLNATGGQQVVDGAGKVIADKSGITDIPAFQKFAMNHPNAGEDFNILMNLAFAGAETGTINPARMADEVARVADKIVGSPGAKARGAQAVSDVRQVPVADNSAPGNVNVIRNEHRIPVQGESVEVPVRFANDYRATQAPINAGPTPRGSLPTIQTGRPRSGTGSFTYEPTAQPRGAFEDLFETTPVATPRTSTARTRPSSEVTARATTESPINSIETPSPRVQTEAGEALNTRAQKLLEAAKKKEIVDETGPIPTHQIVSMADDFARAEDLIARDPDMALKVALGDTDVPGVQTGSVYKAFEERAIATGDVDLIQQLARSTAPTEFGRALKAFDSQNPNSPVRILRDVQRARESLAEKRGGNKPDKIKQEEVKSIEREMEKVYSKRPTWEAFIDELTCGY